MAVSCMTAATKRPLRRASIALERRPCLIQIKCVLSAGAKMRNPFETDFTGRFRCGLFSGQTRFTSPFRALTRAHSSSAQPPGRAFRDVSGRMPPWRANSGRPLKRGFPKGYSHIPPRPPRRKASPADHVGFRANGTLNRRGRRSEADPIRTRRADGGALVSCVLTDARKHLFHRQGCHQRLRFAV